MVYNETTLHHRQNKVEATIDHLLAFNNELTNATRVIKGIDWTNVKQDK